MKLGIIRCQQTEDICPATTDFKFAKEKKGAFADIAEEIEIVGVVSCGGCPGKKAVFRAKEMAKRGVEAIAFASCIAKGLPIGFPCPAAEQMMSSVAASVDNSIKIFKYTH